MFTGIIEAIGKVEEVIPDGSNLHFWISSPFTNELKIDQSVSHNGVCLTVVGINGDKYKVTAIYETLLRSNLGHLNNNSLVNLERCMKADGRFDGHIVQGHVDCTAICKGISSVDGSFEFVFEYDLAPGRITVEKGSITVNGVSLTVVKSEPAQFSVCIIPYTYQHTNFNDLKIGDQVNLEFDIIGKYISRILGK